jgi:hypothetical protein
MAKKLVFVLVLAAMAAGGLCAQEDKKPNTVMFLGSMISYERTLTPNLGIGAEFALDFFGVPSLFYDGEVGEDPWLAIVPLSVDVFGRYYPWGGKFFTQLGLGIQTASMMDGIPGTVKVTGFGFHAKVQVGWHLPLGKSNWAFEAKLGPGMSVGGVSNEDGEPIEKASYFMFSFPIQLGFGISF